MPERERMLQKKNVFLFKAEGLKAEAGRLVDLLYGTNLKDTKLRYENLKTYRVEIQRSFILYAQLAIDGLLRALLFGFLAKHSRGLAKKQLKNTVDEMRSADLVHWCGHLGLIKPKWYMQLLELNRIRNACVHKWLVDVPKYKRRTGGKPAMRIKVPVVRYQGRNLLHGNLFSEDFCPTYGRIYMRLLSIVWRRQGKISA